MIKKRYPKLFGLLSSLYATLMLSGCDMALLDPKGQIGVDEKNLIITATLLMLIVVIPVIIMTVVFAWRYRASNKDATYTPDWSHSNKIEAIVWTVPLLIILVLGTITWETTHSLDPRKPIVSDAKPIVIQVVSLDWKWLFIYPEQGIATVNQLAFPVNVPVEFQITSGTVMNSFFIPQLGSQIYAMAGMKNTLHLIANESGTYKGISANYSGHGFSGMKFDTLVTPQEDFDAWVSKVKASSETLSAEKYAALEVKSQDNPVELFATVKPDLYEDIVAKYTHAGMEMPSHTESKE
ncbi:MAG: ubiquinol oxidase subunit II [Methylophilaceae bacterium]|uniref:ubiquinol oxidase subunit II n=1 Tax=Methylovorus sp. MM2 TaxID=1848038 RepID=UPI0007DE6171|nr:ubiquinol oxidase subunit II [Methylovorus sp. MM2]OAM52317.1 ubiquinol oxidase subunit II [Methylovorus sp. MM2]